MKKLFLLFLLIFHAQLVKADTIANWQIYYNGYLIAKLNEYHKNYQLKISKQLIRRNDLLTINYFEDTPCSKCKSYLLVLSEEKLVSKIQRKGTFSKKKIDLNKLSRLKHNTFKIYHLETSETNDQKPKFLFSIQIEDDNTILKETVSGIINDALKSSFQILTDSTFSYPFGNTCGFAAQKPKGRIAIDVLARNKRYDLVKLVLWGNNQTGKIYAIEKLLKLGITDKHQLTSHDKFLIKKSIQDDIQVETCGGCFYRETTIKELFSDKYFINLLEKNDIH